MTRPIFNVGDKVVRTGKDFHLVLQGHTYTVEASSHGAMRLIEIGGTYDPAFFEAVSATVTADPNGIDQHAPGAKLDAGKVMAGQILAQFPRALQAIAEVGTFGAKKYTLGGWLQVPGAMCRYNDAEVRHWLQRLRGEKVDRESKLPHRWHEVWNALAQLELELIDEEKKAT